MQSRDVPFGAGAPFPQEHFGGRLAALGRKRTQFRGQTVKIGLQFDGKRLTQDFPMLGLHRTAMPGCAALQTQDEFVIEVANIEMAGHGGASFAGYISEANGAKNSARIQLRQSLERRAPDSRAALFLVPDRHSYQL